MAFNSESPPIARLTFRVAVSALFDNEEHYSLDETARGFFKAICTNDLVRDGDTRARPWPPTLARLLANTAHWWGLGQSHAVTLSASAAHMLGMVCTARSIVARKEQEYKDGDYDDLNELVRARQSEKMSKALSDVLGDIGVSVYCGATGDVLFLDAIGHSRGERVANTIWYNAVGNCQARMCDYLLRHYPEQIRTHMDDPLNVIMSACVSTCAYTSLELRDFVLWVCTMLTADQGDDLRRRMTSRALEIVQSCRTIDGMRDRNLVIASCLVWPADMLPMATRLLACTFVHNINLCLTDLLAQALYEAAQALPATAVSVHDDLWVMMVERIRANLCRGTRDKDRACDKDALVADLLLLCHIGERTGNASDALSLCAFLPCPGLAGTCAWHHRAPHHVWRFWARNVEPYVEPQLIDFALACPSSTNTGIHDITIGALAKWLVDHDLLTDERPPSL